LPEQLLHKDFRFDRAAFRREHDADVFVVDSSRTASSAESFFSSISWAMRSISFAFCT